MKSQQTLFKINQAALVFSGSKTLTVEDLEQVIHKVLKQKPQEILIPFSRGALAKFASAFPGFSALFASALRKKGIKKQKQLR